MRLLGALDRDRRVTTVPYQKAGTPEAHGLVPAQCEAAAWTVTPDGARYSGAAAINAALSVALGTRLLMLLYGVAAVGRLQDGVYERVARNRRHLPGDPPYCRTHPGECLRNPPPTPARHDAPSP